MRHPTSGEQLTFERREYRADPIEQPEERHPGDIFIGAVVVGGIIGAVAVWFLERL